MVIPYAVKVSRIKHGGNRKLAVFQDSDLNDRIGRIPFVINQYDERGQRGEREVPDPWCGEPVRAVTAVHHDFAEPQ
jgi:hypothetical protein